MAGTTVVGAALLEELKQFGREQRACAERSCRNSRPEALARRRTAAARPMLQWVARPMGALADLANKEAVRRALDRFE